MNSILEKRSIDDTKKKMNLPTIPKKKIPLNEEVFYNLPVKVYVPKKKEEALSVLKMKREKLMKSCNSEIPTNDQRGSHFKEAGCLQGVRYLSFDCLKLILREGCKSVAERAEYWTKLELINENIQQLIRFANEWDNISIRITIYIFYLIF